MSVLGIFFFVATTAVAVTVAVAVVRRFFVAAITWFAPTVVLFMSPPCLAHSFHIHLCSNDNGQIGNTDFSPAEWNQQMYHKQEKNENNMHIKQKPMPFFDAQIFGG